MRHLISLNYKILKQITKFTDAESKVFETRGMKYNFKYLLKVI